jgi:transcriptional regulator with PAS, ATPase and Fis domain
MDVRKTLDRAAQVDAPLILVGETGTGKSAFARWVHRQGARASRPFVCVNCAGIPDGLFESELFGHVRGAYTGASASRDGLFEQAHGGTLLLDEVGEMPMGQQAKLLSVLEDRQVRRLGGSRVREVDTRVIAATCRDPGEALSAGELRLDLLHRLAVLAVTIPPLRDRPEEDRAALIEYALPRVSARYGLPVPHLSDGARTLLTRHSWPGNVRELIHVLEASLLLGGGSRISARDVERRLRWPAPRLLTGPRGVPAGRAERGRER